MFRNITVDNGVLRKDAFGFSFYIQGNEIYSHNIPDEITASTVISAKKNIFGFYEKGDGTVAFWGPYIAEVRMWR